VFWNGYLSDTVSLSCGVRQGGILSPFLFSVYVDDVLVRLHNLKAGCRIHFMNLNSMMYADDLILLSVSLSDLQYMINVCAEEFVKLDLKTNAKKSGCLRIGRRFNSAVCDLRIENIDIPWCKEMSYLGNVLLAGRKLKYDFHARKAKYFGAVNSILGKIGNNNNSTLVLSLLASKCTPILTYSLESICLQKSVLDNMCYVSNAIYSKIFKTFDKKIIEYCRWIFGYLPLAMDLDLKRLNFLFNLSEGYNVNCSPATLLFYLIAQQDLINLCDKYNISMNRTCSFRDRRNAVWTVFDEHAKNNLR
jgi:hypothetical protein